MTARNIGYAVGLAIGVLFALSVGVLLGLVSFFMAKKKGHQTAGIVFLVICAVSGGLFGLLLTIPVSIVCIIIAALMKKKDEPPTMQMPPQGMNGPYYTGYPPAGGAGNTQGYPPVGGPGNTQGYPPTGGAGNMQGYPPAGGPGNMQGYPPVEGSGNTQLNVCPFCGFQNNADAVYCANCNQKLK